MKYKYALYIDGKFYVIEEYPILIEEGDCIRFQLRVFRVIERIYDFDGNTIDLYLTEDKP